VRLPAGNLERLVIERLKATVVKTRLMSLRCRVTIKLDRIEINLSRHRLAAMLAGQTIDQAMEDPELKPDARSRASQTRRSRNANAG